CWIVLIMGYTVIKSLVTKTPATKKPVSKSSASKCPVSKSSVQKNIIALALLFLPLLFSALFTSSLNASDTQAQQRELYQRATTALARGDRVEFQALKTRLRDYPLYLYLDYALYSADLTGVPANSISRFLAENENTPLAGRLRHQWLESLRRQDRRSDFLSF